MSLLTQLGQKIVANGGLIVSCQPTPDSPPDKLEIVTTMASAAKRAGTVAIRIEGVADLQATRMVVSMPIIGIVKCDLEDSPIRIMVYIENVDVLTQADASIIAVDGTDQPRPMSVETLLARIRHRDLLIMTDCSTSEGGLARQRLGAEIIGITLSDYTTPKTPEEPDLTLVRTLSGAGCRVITGGRYNTPAQATDAMYHGAWAMMVSSVITRLEYICQWCDTAMKKAVL